MKMTRLATAIALAFITQGAMAADASIEQKLEILQKELDELRSEMAKLKSQQPTPQPAARPTPQRATGPQVAGARPRSHRCDGPRCHRRPSIGQPGRCRRHTR